MADHATGGITRTWIEVTVTIDKDPEHPERAEKIAEQIERFARKRGGRTFAETNSETVLGNGSGEADRG